MKPVRIFFRKEGVSAYISHLDLQRVMQRALRRSGLPVWYSQGFNPHIYMRFSLPLPLMQESEAETVDFKTEAEAEDFSPWLGALNAALPEGLTATAIAPPVHDAAEIVSARYQLAWPGAEDAAARAVAAYNALPAAETIQKKKRSEVPVDLKALVGALSPAEGGGFLAGFPAGSQNNINPALLAAFLQQQYGLPAAGAHIRRLRVFTENGGDFC